MEQRVQLKTRARELERNDESEAALELYLRLASDSADDAAGPLWARVGDLQERLGQRDSAAESYTQAVAAFSEVAQRNNAIALCRALIRVEPSSPGAQLRLGELSLAQGFREYAREGICEYARQIASTDHADEAVEPVSAFLQRFPDEDELWREWIEELLGLGKENEAVAILGRLGEIVAEHGLADTAARLLEGMEKIRPSGALPSDAPPAAAPRPADAENVSELPFLGAAPTPDSVDDTIAPLAGLEPTSAGGDWESTDDDGEGAQGLPLLDSGQPEIENVEEPSGGMEDTLPLLDSYEPEGEAEDEPFGGMEEALPLLGSDPFESRGAYEPPAVGDDRANGEAEVVAPGSTNDIADRVEVDESQASAGVPDDFPLSLDIDGIVEALVGISTADIEGADAATHYDLGVAFKEMGRIDESIGNLAMAIRGGHDPVATLEVLGEMLVSSGDYDVVTRLLEEIPGAGERPSAELVGVHYWLARAAEETGRRLEARRAFELVIAVDPTFRDAEKRVRSLA